MSVYPRTPPRVWGRGLLAVSGTQFDVCLSRCRSPEHVAAAIAAERGRPWDGERRPDRIERLTDRLEELQ